MAQGFITEIRKRPTKFGDYHDVYIDGKNLNGGKFPPKGVEVGDFVSYEVEQNAKGYDTLKAGTLAKAAAPQGVAAPAPYTPPTPSSITMDKQEVISRQAALNSALAFVNVLATANALPDGKTLTPAKKADKMEAILMEYVQKFYNYSTGDTYEIPETAAAEAAVNWDEAE